MKNKLLLNNNSRNHIKFMPLVKNMKLPEDEGEQIKWAKETFERLENDENAQKLWHFSSRKKGVLVSVWKSDYYYIIVSLRNEFDTYNNIIYISESENDSIALSKFLSQNYTEITKSYKEQILEAGEDYKKQVNKKVDKVVDIC